MAEDPFALIEQTENLDWLLLTKRPELGIEQLGKWQDINPVGARAIWFGFRKYQQRGMLLDQQWRQRQ